MSDEWGIWRASLIAGVLIAMVRALLIALVDRGVAAIERAMFAPSIQRTTFADPHDVPAACASPTPGTYDQQHPARSYGQRARPRPCSRLHFVLLIGHLF